MKVYTKIGDKGKTQFFGCGMINKDDPRIDAVGAVDELNSIVGLTLSFVEDLKLRDILTKVQHDLFQLGADLVGSALKPEVLPRIREDHIIELENEIDKMEERLATPTSFILPGGTKESSFLHLCRVTTRRAERNLVNIKNTGVININPELLRYVNRLSDFFFVLARQANNEMNMREQEPIYKYFKEVENVRDE